MLDEMEFLRRDEKRLDSWACDGGQGTVRPRPQSTDARSGWYMSALGTLGYAGGTLDKRRPLRPERVSAHYQLKNVPTVKMFESWLLPSNHSFSAWVTSPTSLNQLVKS